jgi:purine-binding chemotaxis protein CheW
MTGKTARQDGSRAMLIFDVGADTYALAGEDVREILPIARLWRPPGAPASVAGMLNLGGDVIPVLSLAALFGLPGGDESNPYRHLLLTRPSLRFGDIALLVDRVRDLAYVPRDEFHAVENRETLNGCVRADFAWDDGQLVHQLDLAQLLLEEEKTRLETMRRAAEARLAEWSDA